MGCDEWDYKSEGIVDISSTVAEAEAKPEAEPEVEASAEAQPEPEAATGVPPVSPAEPLAAADDAQVPHGSVEPEDDAPPEEAETEIIATATAI